MGIPTRRRRRLWPGRMALTVRLGFLLGNGMIEAFQWLDTHWLGVMLFVFGVSMSWRLGR